MSMDLSKLTPETLRELLKLSEKKSALQKELSALDARLSALGTGKSPAPKADVAGKRRGRPPGKAAKAPKAPKAPKAAKAPKAPKAPKSKATGKRGAIKEGIIKLLSAAGSEGVTVKDISAALGVKSQNVHVWFSTTGKKLPEIAKVGEARYAYKVAVAAE
jgi:hypothetical protein